jgi:tellurite resistance-related uncharacterized protein
MTLGTTKKQIEAFNVVEPDTLTTDSPGSHIHHIEEHLHKEANVYPTLTGGVTATSHTDAWTLGNYIEVVPASTISSVYDIHWINVEAMSDDVTFELVLYASTTEICRVRVTGADVANARLFPSIPVITPKVAADTQIQAKVASSGAGGDTITISLGYHTY